MAHAFFYPFFLTGKSPDQKSIFPGNTFQIWPSRILAIHLKQI
jgi:hypothetical protein